LDNVNEVTIEEIQEIINLKKERLRKLRHKEDEFNKNAALVPENDPDIALINDKIIQVKDDVERANQERTNYANELKKVNDVRLNLFFTFFD
jgi:hypothetical protein